MLGAPSVKSTHPGLVSAYQGFKVSSYVAKDLSKASKTAQEGGNKYQTVEEERRREREERHTVICEMLYAAFYVPTGSDAYPPPLRLLNFHKTLLEYPFRYVWKVEQDGNSKAELVIEMLFTRNVRGSGACSSGMLFFGGMFV